MDGFMIIILFIFLMCIAFIMGKRWNAHTVMDEINRFGKSTIRYGETKKAKVTIVGKCEKAC